MTLENRQALAEALFEDCLQLLRDKGEAYSGKKDALANFKINAERMGLSKYQIWAVYFNKHIDSINNATRKVILGDLPEGHKAIITKLVPSVRIT